MLEPHLQTLDYRSSGRRQTVTACNRKSKGTAILALTGRFEYRFENVHKVSVENKGEWQAHKPWATFKLRLYKRTHSG